VGQAERLLANISDEAEAEAISHSLTKTMQTMNRAAGAAPDMAAEDLLGDLAKLADRAGGAFGPKMALGGEDSQNEAAGQIAGKTPLEALHYLAGRLAPAAESTVVAPAAESALTPAAKQHGSTRGLQADAAPAAPTDAEPDESIGESVNFVAKAIAALAEKAEQMAADAQAQADSAPEPTSPPPAANPTNQPQRKPTRD
jgi:hypothetical protein